MSNKKFIAVLVLMLASGAITAFAIGLTNILHFGVITILPLFTLITVTSIIELYEKVAEGFRKHE